MRKSPVIRAFLYPYQGKLITDDRSRARAANLGSAVLVRICKQDKEVMKEVGYEPRR